MSQLSSSHQTFRQKISTIHPLLILPVVGGAAWLAADLLPGVNDLVGNEPAQAKQTAGAHGLRALQQLVSALPAQMPTTLYAAIPAAAVAEPAAYPPSYGGGGGGGGGMSGGGGGSGAGGTSGQPNPSGTSAPAAPRHPRAWLLRHELLRAMRYGEAPTVPRPPPRVAYGAPAAPRIMPAPPVAVYRPSPSYGGGFAMRGGYGGFRGGGGHFGGRR